ncbi:MAG TPA: hypothetical protein VFS99_00055 [Xanthomonadaceae bacterium]|nr:hypothetical protein [Xanthomonadaceae bacterium]
MSAAPAPGRSGRWLMVAAGAVVLGAVVAAMLVMDSPSRQRAERLDGIRVDDLQLLASRIDAHADVHERLPERLAVVSGAPGRAVADPGTGQAYQYEITGERSYRLCATFETAPQGSGAPMPVHDEWRHGEGRQCFEREVEEVVEAGVPAPATR